MTAAPVRYTPAVETPEPDEAETGRDLVAAMRKITETTYADGGHALRSVHAKSHGLLEGELHVLPGLSPTLAQGIFAKPGTYPVVMRLSTNPGDILDDSVSTPRGLGLKIIGVEGPRLPGSEGAVTQDFVMANAPAFAAANAKAFLGNVKLLAATTDKAPGLKKVLSAALRGVETLLESVGTKSPTLISLGGHPEHHILGETFYSQVPLLWGDYIAKVSVAPVSPELTALVGAPLNVNGVPNGLRDAVVAFFKQHEGTWEVRVQLCTNLDTMPIENAKTVWSEDESPYVPVARITVPQQSAYDATREQRLNDGLAFSPWHGIAAHRPLGSIMRVRRAAYEMSAGFRGERNGCPIHEPREQVAV